MDNGVNHNPAMGTSIFYACDTNLYDQLKELVLCCDETGLIQHANAAARRRSSTLLEGQHFTTLLVADAVEKGKNFFAAARAATPQQPAAAWELSLGTVSDYVMASFSGYRSNGQVIVLAEVEPDYVGQMQHDMQELTSELAEAQRQLRRQNRALQTSLDEQRRLLQTIQELSAPIAPIADGVLLLPLVGHIDSQRAQRITSEILQRVNASRTHYVILDVTSIASIDTAVAQHLIDTARSLRLLGARPVLVGFNPAIAETVVHLGIDLREFTMQSDLQHAIAYVLRQPTRRNR